MVFATISRHLGSHRRTDTVRNEAHVQVRGGYHPNTIRSTAGEPLRIVFRRDESSSCSEQVVFPAFGKSVTLPQGEDVPVDLVPGEPGVYEFTCAMGMLRGRLVITPASSAPTPASTASADRHPSARIDQDGGERR